MANPNPVQSEEFLSQQFKPKGQQPLGKVRGIRLPIEVDAAIEALPEKNRSEWMRRVITEAAQRELMNTEQTE